MDLRKPQWNLCRPHVTLSRGRCRKDGGVKGRTLGKGFPTLRPPKKEGIHRVERGEKGHGDGNNGETKKTNGKRSEGGERRRDS